MAHRTRLSASPSRSHNGGSTSESTQQRVPRGWHAQSGLERDRPVCVLALAGRCTTDGFGCPHGTHLGFEDVPPDTEVLEQLGAAKMCHLEKKWRAAIGVTCPYLPVRGWQVRNPRLDAMYRATQTNMVKEDGKLPDEIDAWHGTPAENVLGIAREGFAPEKRARQVYGDGEYFAKDPRVSIAYCKGDAYLFLCKLLLGEAGRDHTWVDQQKH
eukprot:Sspe_Gene.102241::Locus_77147_Transcript_1_1_Confidence_1.000_Length_682::g.102241::m.102241